MSSWIEQRLPTLARRTSGVVDLADSTDASAVTFDAVVGRSDAGLIRLGGELDAAAVPRLRAAVAGLEGTVTVDLAGVDFLDSGGLRALLTLNRERHLVLCNLSAPVVRLFAISGVANQFTIQQLD